MMARRSKSLLEWMGPVKPTDIDFSSVIRRVQKSFYYDCQDANKLPDEYFAAIRRVSGSHVRFGTLKGKSNKKPARQKEVDILLAVDMMNHAIRKNMNEAILLAGDLDYLPLIESLIEMGCFVSVWAYGKDVAQELREAADEFRELTFSDFYSWASQSLRHAFPIPQRDSAQLTPTQQSYTFLKMGKYGDQEVELYGLKPQGYPDPKTFSICEANYDPHSYPHGIRFSFEDLARLELFFKLQYGEIRWD
jgi:NYN domain